MASILDMSLDDIAKMNAASKPRAPKAAAKPAAKPAAKQAASKAAPARGPVRGNSNNKPAAKPYERSSSAGRGRGSDSDQWSHDKHGSSSSSSSGPRKQLESGSKILISNLNWEVTQDNLKELFSECGEVRRASIAFDRTGRSEGHGEVSFASRGAAEIAVKEFNGALLDGLALKIIVAGGHSTSTSSLSSSSSRNNSSSSSRNNSSSSSSSSAPAKFDGECNNCGKKGHKKVECRQPGGGAHKDGASAKPAAAKQAATKPAATKPAAAKPAAAKPAAARAPKPAVVKAAPKTQAELDAEMDSYFGTSAAAAASE